MITLAPVKPFFQSALKGTAYALALLGSALGGFPPPPRFVREEEPSEVIVRVMDNSELGEHDTVEARLGLVVTTPDLYPVRTPEAPRRKLR